MSSSYLIPLAGLLYTAVFTAMAALRREGFSPAFVVQSLLITAVLSVVNLLGGGRLAPLPFLLALYLLTMRVRIVLDVGSMVASRGKLAAAERIYDAAMQLLPSALERCLVAINKGVCRLQGGDPAAAASLISDVIAGGDARTLGVKYQSAARFNLGVAYRKQGRDADAKAEFQRVVELWPVSEYARRAGAALKQVP